MAAKRPHHTSNNALTEPPSKKRRGFVVGPANLPEGTYKQKTQQIKRDLIAKAKIKREYAKIRARELERPTTALSGDEEQQQQQPSEPASTMHPERLTRLETSPATSPPPSTHHTDGSVRTRRPRRPKQSPYAKEQQRAAQRKEEQEARVKRAEEGEKERQQRLAEREKARRTMAKARGQRGGGGRKLGKESTVLLDRVKRLMKE